jgi:hypothetical protein
MKGYDKLNINQCLPAFQMLFPAVEKALEKVNLEWIDYKRMKNKEGNDFSEILKRNKKRKLECNFKDQHANHPYKALLKKINTTCNRKRQRRYRTELYSNLGTKDLILKKGNGSISNSYFNNNKLYERRLF